MNRIVKVVSVIATSAAMMLAMSACNYSTADQANANDRQASGQMLSKFEQSQPAPQFDYSQIRQTLIDAQTAQANATQTTSFFFVRGVPDPVFTCPSIGFPVPATDQITNPSQVTDGYGVNGTGTGNVTIAQIDPNGVYSGDSSATFVICVNAQGKPYLHHAEEDVHTIAGPAVWDVKSHQIQITGDPTFNPKISK